MAEQILSPGVFSSENDQSFITQGPVTVGAAIIGPTVKGKVGIPTIVTSYSDFTNKFGSTLISGGANYSYFTSVAVYNYFDNGGTSMLVTRIASGSYTPAVSTAISASTQASSQPSFTLETLSVGTLMNSSGSEDNAGALISGSSDNLRWEISQADTSSGQFTLLIRQGNDTTNNKSILETWSNLSLDPLTSNYIEKVIGNQIENIATDGSTYYVQTSGSFPNLSRYIRIKSVNLSTPNYFDNNGVAKAQYTSSIPLVASGTFNSATGAPPTNIKFYENITATNTQGLSFSNYTQSISLLSNKDDYKYTLIVAPGLIYNFSNHPTPLNSIMNNARNRGDHMAVIDLVEYGSNTSTTVSKAVSIDNSYAASYWPWVQTVDPNTGNYIWVPASTMIPGIYAQSDSVSEAWFAPAGFSRGGLNNVIQAEQRLPQTTRDTLYSNKVNPIATFPGQGVVVFGQKTLQTKASALDRVGVRRLLITLKSYISQVSNNLVFEQNSIATRNNFLAQVNPYLESVKQRQGLYAYKVVMDDSNNTADVIDRNQLVGQIYLQPTKTAEFILLDFNILPTGATFS
jgi:phage tail sheath protein FI